MDQQRKIPGWTSQEIVEEGERLARRLARPGQAVSSNQLRKFLGALRKIEARGESRFHVDDVIFLKVPLTWASAREPKLEEFREKVESRIDYVDTFEKFKGLTRFVEAIVAYHKKHGGPP